MNRNDLKVIVEIGLKESKALLDQKHYDGAYYLAGYAVECALKACIAKQTKRYDFPNKTIVRDSYTHDLKQLIRVAELQGILEVEMVRDADFAVNWAIVKDWSSASRYELHEATLAKSLYDAVTNKKHGVFRWLKRHW